MAMLNNQRVITMSDRMIGYWISMDSMGLIVCYLMTTNMTLTFVTWDCCIAIQYWLVVCFNPSEKYESQLVSLFPIYGKT